MNKFITLEFNDKNPTNKDSGFKFVLYEVTTSEPVQVKNDWGFAYWNGKSWDPLELPEGWTSKILWWAHTPDPGPLLKKNRKIFTLN